MLTSEMRIVKDYNSRIALEFSRGHKWSEFVMLDPNGPRKAKLLTSTFEKTYYRASSITVKEGLLALLRASHRAYIPDEGVTTLLLEAYIMSATSDKNDLAKRNTAEILTVYNELATAVGKKPLKAYKGSKADLLKRLEELKQHTVELTPSQIEAKTTNAAQAARRLAGLCELKDSKAANPTTTTKESNMATTKTAATKTKAKAAPAKATATKAKAAPAKAAPAKKGSGGIGGFCIDLIRAGKGNEDILDAVRKKFPDAKTSAASIAWYRNKVKNEG